MNDRKAEKDLSWERPFPKLHIPIIPREFLERPRLLWRFGAALSHKVILVTAPPGYGKTVFLSQSLTHVDRPIAWLSLDKRDNDLVRFWAGLIMALQEVQPSLGENALAGLRFRKPSIESALTELVNDIAEAVPNLILVLDDYHEINVQAVHDSVSFLIDYLPAQVRLIISSRVDPPLPLIRLRGRGHLAQIKAADLQFTREETYSFLNKVMGLALSKDVADSLHDRTEGWIAGLQMVAVSMQGRPSKNPADSLHDPAEGWIAGMMIGGLSKQGHHDAAEYLPTLKGTNKEIMEYLNKEVLEQQEEHIRTFLLQTCILERLTESLCNAVTGRHDSQRILEKLVAAHLFLQPLDEEGRWFRYHQLFSDLLHKQLEATQPAIIPALHSRASEWYESQGLTEDAIEHALSARDFERASTLMQSIVFTMLGQDKVSKIRDWVARLPEEFVAKNLLICIAGAFNCEAIRQHEMAEPYRRYAQLMSNALETPAQPGSAQTDTARGFLAMINSMNDIYNGNYSKAITYLLEEMKSLPEDESVARCSLNYTLGYAYWGKGELEASYRSFEEGLRLSKQPRYSYITIQAAAALAHIRFARGHLKSAAEACREAIQLGTDSDGKESSIVCYARLLLGEILYQWNSLDESRDNIERAIRLSAQVPDPVIHLNANMALARIAIAQGQSDAAIEIARRSRITHEGDSRQRAPADVFLSRLWLMLGNVAAASDYAHTWSELLSIPSSDLAQVNPLPYLIKYGIYHGDIRDVWTETRLLTFLRLRLSQHKLDGMLDLLEYVCQDVETKGWQNILVEALILKALVLYAQGKLAHALRILGDVLTMTEKEGYVRVFVDEGLPMFQLLQRASSRGISPLYGSRLLSAFNMPAANTPSQSEKLEVEGGAPSLAMGLCSMAEPLTKREIELLELISVGLPNREIAKKLSIALPTVKNYLHIIYGKLDVNNRARAITRAQEIGLLSAPLLQD